MENPTDQAEASIPTETDMAIDDTDAYLNFTFTFTVRRKAAKRSEAWYQKTAVPLPPSPRAEDFPARKKLRIEEPLPITTAEGARKTASADVLEGLPPPPAADNENVDVNTDPVMDTQSNAVATVTTGRWTREEDGKLTRAVTNTRKRKRGKEHMIDWVAISAEVPCRTKRQCSDRWHDALDPDIALTAGRSGKWTKDEDTKLKNSVQMHGGKDWAAIAALVPGRTRSQCFNRWHENLKPRIDPLTRRAGKWTEDEDTKLKDAVRMHGYKDWAAVTMLVPGRTNKQCRMRWHDHLKQSINRATGRADKCKWTEEEDLKLKNSVQMHGCKEWAAVAALFPGRTKTQCKLRWHDVLDPNIALTAGRRGKWTKDEDTKLKNSVQMHGGKNWAAIAALVPGRTKIQCKMKWHDALLPSVTLTAVQAGKWTEDEDTKLKDAVQMHGGKNWAAIAALVPGRTKKQCNNRWKDGDPSIALTAGRAGKWTQDEDLKLKNSVQMHGDKDWAAIAALVPGRTRSQCFIRWRRSLHPSVDRTNRRTSKWTEEDIIVLKNSVQM